MGSFLCIFFFFFQAEDGIRDAQESRGLGDVYKRQAFTRSGVDSDLYLLDDIFHPNLKAPQILCFADAVELTPLQAEKIRTTLGLSLIHI